ncbi:GTPase ObgE [Hujiaoplasma nucleasis]|uniref:GTPase Obg n=1 Tax=Hujiaoplasma nucleasis TaxID=2725268 RepID=A0A7L6N381_9MOLU|nr:GTPase ObgE [Hujiaoplasma nucleasis]QLY39678.1 GTPase ObgE [Hujiaoplasma nucleasis]
MFIDEVNILVRSGKGGDGKVAFRREKYVPKGGPAGGNGGKGGSIIFQADEGKSTLTDLKYQKHVFAKDGEPGKNKNMAGKDAEDVIVMVPIGTIIYNEKTNEVLADLTKHGEQSLIAKGGRGGRGNTAFANSRNKAPKFQENGELGQELDLRVELKLLADVGLIGFPSVGKSTLITILSKASPKIGDYPFTTITPNLGVVEYAGVQPFVLADMPGLIEGAHQGAGLGIQFLKHIERTRVLLHMVDMSPSSLRDPYQDYQTINNELEKYEFDLLKRPQIIVASKMDEDGAEARLKEFKDKLPKDTKIYPISAMTNQNLKELVFGTKALLDQTPFFYEKQEVVEEYVEYHFEEEKDIEIRRTKDDTYNVTGALIEKTYRQRSLATDENIQAFLAKLRKAGLDQLLRESGAKNGDTIIIYDLEFEFVE